MNEQLELFSDSPFSVRLKIDEALRIFWDNYWFRLPSAQKTIVHRRRIIEFFSGRFIETIGKTDIENFRRHLKTLGLKESTINRAHTVLGRMYAKLDDWKHDGGVGDISFAHVVLPRKNPVTKVKKPSEMAFARKTIVTPEDFRLLRGYADDDLKDILNVLMWTGLRAGDLRHVTSENVSLPLRMITGIQRKTITNRNPVGVPYKVHLTSMLEALVRFRMSVVKPGTPLFNFRNMKKRWEGARALAGMPLVQMRDLRRSAATYLIRNGESIKNVSQTLGHTTTDMTERYALVENAQLRKATGALVEAFK